MKNIRSFSSEDFQFFLVKLSIYLNRCVFVIRKEFASLGSNSFLLE